MPAETPVTMPEVPMEATDALLVLHVPVPAPSARVVVAPTQTFSEPVMVPAIGSGFTVTVAEVAQLVTGKV